ncbi:MAG: O-acetyl-ADP-ribose deacetylase (regulator of RNase III) [Planctomycetaceae bacterium]|jgi:O-acetyl-ADP-ribose deacetylase (regulator of RNase III)
MLNFTTGNLLEAEVDALVNTVNTVGVMGKGIALMFKEQFSDNFTAYAAACKRGDVTTGRMFVTASPELMGPRWIINFPTKQHWRTRTKMEWIQDGLQDLRRVIEEKQIKSIAVPPLGCGNGGLNWQTVRPIIQQALGDLEGVDVVVFEPTAKYQNVAKRSGVKALTPARALIVEMIRRYCVLGFDCSILEIQKLAWFLGRVIQAQGLDDPLALDFDANLYGPFAPKLTHLLNALDGSYLHCDKRLTDASPMDTIRVDQTKKNAVADYLDSDEARPFSAAIEQTDTVIDGFQSPLGMEVLATVDWLLVRENVNPTVDDIRDALTSWTGGPSAGERKNRVFSDKLLEAAVTRLQSSGLPQTPA